MKTYFLRNGQLIDSIYIQDLGLESIYVSKESTPSKKAKNARRDWGFLWIRDENKDEKRVSKKGKIFYI